MSSPEHGREVAGELREIGGIEQRKRLAVDLDHADAARALGNARRALLQERAQIRDTLHAPFVEQCAHAGEVFEP
jgi:hypothetical protein